MDATTPIKMTPAQVDQLFHFLMRESTLRDYAKLYPDMQARFAVVLAALPDQAIRDTVRALETTELPRSGREKLALGFDLTEAETEVALLLIAGHSLGDIADIRQISRNTARNHLQSVYEKTRTTRQPELIRLLHDFLDEK